MSKGVTIQLAGAHAAETERALAMRLIELGHRVERIDQGVINTLGSDKAVALVCYLLSRNGVLVLDASRGMRPEGDVLEVELDPNDTPDFAAEKVLDTLAGEGIVDLEASDYSPEEEEEIKKRLSDLGYIE
jgi:hypothetical protein